MQNERTSAYNYQSLARQMRELAKIERRAVKRMHLVTTAETYDRLASELLSSINDCVDTTQGDRIES
ncbi:MAG TPA: hypothetical protein VHU18_10395 [Rhizomicrobium sp.]|jgi:hypothetical protein|nr:hypothetical protein [Rhizomicrobium sp.]